MDGMPLFKSSKIELWPILFKLKNCTYTRPLPIAIFCGIGKPDLLPFLEQLAD
jgi:hypothetical protein